MEKQHLHTHAFAEHSISVAKMLCLSRVCHHVWRLCRVRCGASPCRCVQSKAAATPCVCVSGRVHVCVYCFVCARALPPAPLEPGCVAMYVVCVVCAVSNSSHAASSCRGACACLRAMICRPSVSLERGCHEGPLGQDVAPISVSPARLRRHVCVVVNIWGVAPLLSCMLYFRSCSSVGA